MSSELDPQVVAFLERLAASGAPPLGSLPPPEMRHGYDTAAPGLFGRVEEMVAVEDVETDSGTRVRVYRPVEVRGTLVYFHGGGWVVGSLDSHDGVVRALAHHSRRVTIAVDYRLAPEHPFPAAVDDALAAADWAVANFGDVAVGGDSSGATLAAVVARRRPVECQVLICPVLDHRFDTGSYEQFAEGYFLTRDAMRWYWGQYLGSDDGSSPDASPLRAEIEPERMPPAIILVAGCDPLRDEGLAYAAKLEEAGVRVDLLRYDGMIHNFIRFGASIDRAGEALAAVARLLP